MSDNLKFYILLQVGLHVLVFATWAIETTYDLLR